MPESTLEASDVADLTIHLPLKQSAVETSLVSQMINTYRTNVRDQIASLEQQIKNQENLLQNQYSGLKNMPYHLHGICIHDGTAESGHYFSYIKDHTQNVWRQYNDHRVNIVDEEQVLQEAMGGGLTKSAYWVVYISEEELQRTRAIDENAYDPIEANYEQKHPYGQIADQRILKKIVDDNRALVAEVDQFKNNEVAKKVTTLYEKYFDEIQKVVDQKVANKDIASIYTFLLTKGETVDLAKRMLMDQCFFEETKQRV